MSDGMTDAYREAREHQREQLIFTKDDLWLSLAAEIEEARTELDNLYARKHEREKELRQAARTVEVPA
jgi:nuclear transport factor 2 (NTF2) superfamily protein